MTLGPMRELVTLAEEIHGGDRLLLRSASVMQAYAREYCGTNWSDLSETCEPYHGWWQYWRLAELADTPNFHYQHFRDFIADNSRRTQLSLLICGTADYGILHHLVQVTPRGRLESTQIAVLDFCRTPLKICSWYSAEQKSASGLELDLSCYLGDAVHSPFADQSFDLITSYDFLPRFEDVDKARLVREWRRILKPGGRIVTTSRLAPVVKDGEVDSEAPAFPEHVLWQISNHKPWLLPARDAIVLLSGKYSRTVVSRFSTIDYLYKLFEDFGLAINVMDFDTLFAGTERYACIVAVKD